MQTYSEEFLVLKQVFSSFSTCRCLNFGLWQRVLATEKGVIVGLFRIASVCCMCFGIKVCVCVFKCGRDVQVACDMCVLYVYVGIVIGLLLILRQDKLEPRQKGKSSRIVDP